MNCSFRQIKATRGWGGYKWDFTVPLQVTQLTQEQLLSCTGTIDFPET